MGQDLDKKTGHLETLDAIGCGTGLRAPQCSCRMTKIAYRGSRSEITLETSHFFKVS